MFNLHRQVACFPINKAERRHPQGSLKCSPICPKRIMKVYTPILPSGVNNFFQDRLDLPIGNLHLTTRLLMIRYSYSMRHPILLQKCFKAPLMKCEQPSLIRSLGTPNLGNIMDFMNLDTTLELFIRVAIASTHLDT